MSSTESLPATEHAAREVEQSTAAQARRLPPAEWNDTYAPYDRSATIVDLVRAAVERTPGSVAVESSGPGPRWTYAELWREAGFLADRLRSSGVRSGSFVAVLDDHTAFAVLATLGVLRTGAAYVPLDVRWPVARLAEVLTCAEPVCLLATADLVGLGEQALWRAGSGSTPVLTVGPARALAEAVSREDVQLRWDEVARAPRLAEAAGFGVADKEEFDDEVVGRYVDHVCSLVADAHPSPRVFDVGCGVGLVGGRLASRVQAYAGMDPSSVAVERFRETAPDVVVSVGYAHDVASRVSAGTNVILLASVVQFFPDLAYLRGVVAECLSVLPADGALVLADVVDADALPAGAHLAVHPAWLEEVSEQLDARAELIRRHPESWPESLSTRYDVVLTRRPESHTRLDSGALRVPGRPAAGTSVRPDTTAYAIFTSGSTGTPKGVVVQHTSVVNLIEWMNVRYAVGPGDRLLWVTALTFDLSVYDLFGTLAAGATLCVPPSDALNDPELLGVLVHDEAITVWDSAPAMLAELVTYDVPSSPRLRLVLLSGDWVPVPLPDRIRQVFPRSRLTVLGGATEATVWSNFFDVEEVDASWPSIPYGRPIQNARYYVLDDDGTTCGLDEPGHLYIAGVPVAQGYLGLPAATHEKFLPDPFWHGPDARMYATGDRAMWLTEGVLRFLGRRDEQVKIRGYRVELGDVRAALLKMPGVQDAVALVDRGTEVRLVAAVAMGGSRDDGRAVRAVREHARALLPSYMVPDDLVVLPAFPVTANGKVDREALLGSVRARRASAVPTVDAVAPPDRTVALLRAAELAPEGSYGLGLGLRLAGTVAAGDMARAVRGAVRRFPELSKSVRRDEDSFVWTTRAVEDVLVQDVLHVAPQPVPAADQLAAMRAALPHRADQDLFRLVWSPRPEGTLVHLWLSHAIADGAGRAEVVRSILGDLPLAAAGSADAAAGEASRFGATAGSGQARLPGVEEHPTALDRTVSVSGLTAFGRRCGVTPTAALVTLVRVAAARALRWQLERVTVPCAFREGALLSVDPLPVRRLLAPGATLAESMRADADALYTAMERGPVAESSIASECSSVLSGLPDCLVAVDEIDTWSGHPAVAEVFPDENVGSPAVLTVEVGPAGLRVAGHPRVLTGDDCREVAETIARLVLDDQAAQQPIALGPEALAAPRARDGAPAGGAILPSTTHPLEATVLAVWREIIAVSAEPTDDMFLTGATSLEAARLAAGLRRALGKAVTVRAVYQNPTPRGLTQWLRASGTVPPDADGRR